MGIIFIVLIAMCALIYIKNIDDVEEDIVLVVDNDINQILTDGIQGMLILMLDNDVEIFNDDGIKSDVDSIKPGMRIYFRYKSDVISGYPGIVKKVFEIRLLE